MADTAPPSQTLAGRTALVTGGTQGLGAALALAVARAGAHVVVHGLQADQAGRQIVRACQDYGVRASLIEGDLSQAGEECVARVFERAMAYEPGIDLLINNAGGYFDPPFLQLSYATFETTMRLNVFAPCFLTQRFARHWVQAGVAGRVLIIGSINGRLAEPAHVAYDTSKGAVEMLVRSLCVELAPLGVRVNGLAPGLFYTPLTAAALDQDKVRRWMQCHTPNRQVPGPEVAGDAAVFLLSDAASHIHGHMLLVDGGMSIWQQPDPPPQWK